MVKTIPLREQSWVYFACLLFFSCLNLSGCANLSEWHNRPNEIALRQLALKSLPMALKFCYDSVSWDTPIHENARVIDSTEPCNIMPLVIPIAADNYAELDENLIDLMEFYSGHWRDLNEDLLALPGERILPLIKAVIGTPLNKLGYTERDRRFIAAINYDPFLEQESRDQNLMLQLKKYQPVNDFLDFYDFIAKKYSINDIEEEKRNYAALYVQYLPRVQAGYIKNQSVPGWPHWFNVGVLIEVLRKHSNPYLDGYLLELLEFSLSAELDAKLHDVLLFRLTQNPAMHALVAARLDLVPTWFGYLPYAIESIKPYGVVTRTKEQRNAELQKLLAAFTAR